MMRSAPEDSAATLQEAIDTVAQVFSHPVEMELHYRGDSGEKLTAITVTDGDETATYELRFDGSDDRNEPTLRAVRE